MVIVVIPAILVFIVRRISILLFSSQTILELESLLQYKLDQGCHQVFRDASILADQETGNLQKTLGGQVITLSCWGNLAKNPR